MPLEVLSTHVGGDVVVLAPKVIGDERGFFMETYRSDNFREQGLPTSSCRTTTPVLRKGCCAGFTFSGNRLWASSCGSPMGGISGRCRHPQRFANAGQVVRRGGLGGEQEAGLGSRRLCPRLLRADGWLRNSVQVHRAFTITRPSPGSISQIPASALSGRSSEVQLSEKDARRSNAGAVAGFPALGTILYYSLATDIA